MSFRTKRKLAAITLAVSAVAFTSSALATSPQPPVANVKGDLSVMVLGSGGPMIQSSGRASAGYMLFVDGKPYAIMDAGSGTFKSIAMSGAHIGDINTILLSHLHIDHASEVPGIIKGIYMNGRGVTNTTPIDVYGPEGRAPNYTYKGSARFPSTSEFMNDLFAKEKGAFTYLRRFVGGIDGGVPIIGVFGYTAHNLSSDWQSGYLPHVIVDDTTTTGSEIKITEVAIDHYEAPAVAYRIDYKGHSIVYTGDTHSTSDNLVYLAHDADYLIYDTSILDQAPPSSSPFSVFFNRHTPPARIAAVAKAACVKTLVLSHITSLSGPNLKTVIIPEISNVYGGNIEVADDLKVYNTD